MVQSKVNPPIILASASAQRKKLLALAGVRFIVRPSHTRETSRITTTCEDLVIQNALRKARDVARHYKAGLVIGADTVVFDGVKTIIGKPRDLAHARCILRQLCARPHWVYTGLAIMDCANDRTVLGCEKTKVFMQHLTDAEMRAYHARTTPLDKAGGFDIEGRGGLFIRRIEGCYSNVIGLPMARLRNMLARMGVQVLR